MTTRPQAAPMISIGAADSDTMEGISAAIRDVLMTAYECRASEQTVLAALNALTRASSVNGVSVEDCTLYANGPQS